MSNYLSVAINILKILKIILARFQDMGGGLLQVASHQRLMFPWMMNVPDSSVCSSVCPSHCLSVCPSHCLCVRTGCPRLPSPQTQSSAGSSARWSPGRSLVRSLDNRRSFNSRVPGGGNPPDVTWRFEASKRHLHGGDVVVVDEAGTCFQALHHAVRSCHIPTHKLTRLRLFFLPPRRRGCRPTGWRRPLPDPWWCHWPSAAPLPPTQTTAQTWPDRRSPPSRRSCRPCSRLPERKKKRKDAGTPSLKSTRHRAVAARRSYPEHTESCSIRLWAGDLLERKAPLHTAPRPPGQVEHPVKLRTRAAAALRPAGGVYLLPGSTDKGEDFFQVRPADQRSHPRAPQQGVSYLDGTGPLHHLLHKLGQNLPVDEHSSPVATDLRRTRYAQVVRRLRILAPGRGVYLALGQEIGHEGSSHGVLHIGVLKDEQRRFASQLQSHRLHSLGGHLHNLERENHVDIFNISTGGEGGRIFQEGLALLTFFPVGTLPVKDTLATSGCRQSNPPVSWPPCTTLNSPSGAPASA